MSLVNNFLLALRSLKGFHPCKNLFSVYLMYRKYLIHRTKVQNISFQKCLHQKISFQVSTFL